MQKIIVEYDGYRINIVLRAPEPRTNARNKVGTLLHFGSTLTNMDPVACNTKYIWLAIEGLLV